MTGRASAVPRSMGGAKRQSEESAASVFEVRERQLQCCWCVQLQQDSSSRHRRRRAARRSMRLKKRGIAVNLRASDEGAVCFLNSIRGASAAKLWLAKGSS